MRAIGKRIAVLLLVIVMATTMAPIAVLGTSYFSDIYQDDLEWGDENGITRAQWLHNLVVVFEMENQEESLPDNYFSDLSFR